MKQLNRVALTGIIALALAACGTPNNTNIRSKEKVQCKHNEVMICTGAMPSRLPQDESEDGEFCHCEYRDVGLSGTN